MHDLRPAVRRVDRGCSRRLLRVLPAAAEVIPPEGRAMIQALILTVVSLPAILIFAVILAKVWP